MVDMQPSNGGQQPNLKDLMEPQDNVSNKNSHYSPKSTRNEEKETINLRMFLCAVNEKKKLTIQSIQSSIAAFALKIS